MSFGKLKSPRISDTTPKVGVPSPDLGNGSGSHTSLASRRQLHSTPMKNTQRSRSLSVSNKNCDPSSTISVTALKSGITSKIPVQTKVPNAPVQNRHPAAERSPSVGGRNKTKSHSRMPSPVPGVKSLSTTVKTKVSAPLKLPRASTPNAASGISCTTVTSAPVTPRTRSPLRSPGRLNHVAPKKPVTSPLKGKPIPVTKKESSQLSSDKNSLTNKTTTTIQRNASGDEEIIKNINLSNLHERKPYENTSRPKEIKIDMKMIGDLLNVISEECFSLCKELNEQNNSILTNLIDIGVNLRDDVVLNEKIANYLEGGYSTFQKYELLKQSQNVVSSNLCGLVSGLNSETIALRSLCNDLENKLELLEAENDHTSKQMKILSEELDSEREKIISMNQKKTQLEQQLKKLSQRIKELESKSSASDIKIYQQSTQLKTYEAQLKQKDDKYHILEQKFSHQAKQCRIATEVKEKLEKQRESLELRVSDLKQLKADQKNDSSKVEEKLQQELNETYRLLENEKQLREDVELELKNTHDRLITVQEKSLELTDMTEVTRATIAQEGYLKASKKEAELYMNLNEVQHQLNKANEKIDNYKQENEELRIAVFQATDSMNKNASDNEVSSIISVLKTEVVSKDETIRSLRQQVDTFLKEADARGQSVKKLEQNWNEGKIGFNGEDQEVLWQEILELRHHLVQAEKDNEENVKQLTKTQLELEQRERVMREQAKVLQVRDELLKLLRRKDRLKTGQMTALKEKFQDQEQNTDMVKKIFSAKAEQLQEMYSTLEMKQRQVMQLEDEVKQLEAQNERGQCQRTRLEARIAELELAVHEKGRTSCASSIYNPRCKPSTFSSPPIRPYYMHSLHREPQDVCNLPQSHPLNCPLRLPMNKPHYQNRLPHAGRYQYLRQNDKTQSVLQLYRTHSSSWGDSTYSYTKVETPHCWPSATQFNQVNKAYAF